MSQLVWLVTGCSSGFGEQFVREILSRGDLVIATARKPEKIKHLEQPGVTILPLDISSDQSTLDETVSKAISIHGRVDVLVNNAAYAMLGSWEDVERSGTMVFIGSRAGWYGDGFAGPYAGSKFALDGLVECLRRETAELGIKTLLIEPGRFKTKLLSTGSAQVIPTSIPDYASSNTTFVHRIAAEDQTQPGDTGKGVRIIVDLVRREGHAATREVPFRLPLGRDCYDTIKEKCEETLAVLRDWEYVIKSTDHDA
ncbi:hypothetical protein F5X96DRAFT_692271 [Biscogniauxia mediterranea]|nr:hypothetical protein F5X96DRAFT_692271 [Biscogniauxia mediterranea]